LPWLVATALLHSVMLQERRGMLKVWNLALAVGGFALTTFGTFLTRGSILSSVHAFAQSAVGPMYLGFLLLVLVGGFGLIAAQAWRLRSEGRFDSVWSRESAFLGNNLVLLAVTFIVLLGTIFPLLVEALTGRQSTVGGPYFKQTTAPLFLLLLFLMGVGPLLPWRRASALQVRPKVTVPAAAGALTMLGLAVAGVRNVAAVAGIGMGVFVGVANASEVVRGLRSFARAHGRSVVSSVPEAVSRNRRLYGGLVVHVGFAIAAVAITVSSSFARSTEVSLAVGQRTTFARYTLSYEGQRVVQQPQRQILIADVAVSRDGRSLGTVHPSLNLYPAAAEPIGTPSIKYGVFRDLYSSVIGFESDGRRATLRFFLNPGVMWLWVGGGIMAIGGLVALWPSKPRRRVGSPEPPLPERELVATA
jgi:cytochrome c-type biogenesis protein CcmF